MMEILLATLLMFFFFKSTDAYFSDHKRVSHAGIFHVYHKYNDIKYWL